MLDSLSTPALTFVFLCLVIFLGAALIWAFWEMERASRERARSGRQTAPHPHGPRR